MSAPLPGLACRDLLVRRGDFTLSVPRLDLGPGLAVVRGPNGSGKSTLLLACAGLLDLEAGTITLAGELLHRGRAPAATAARRRVAVALQHPWLGRGSVAAVVDAGLAGRGLRNAARRARIDRVLAALALDALARRDAGSLSAGQASLVALARALVLEPQLLIADEVSADLDEAHRALVRAALGAYAARPGATVLLATHDQALLAGLSAQRLALAGGQVIHATSDNDTLESPSATDRARAADRSWRAYKEVRS